MYSQVETVHDTELVKPIVDLQSVLIITSD
jgi:hypothetical protein